MSGSSRVSGYSAVVRKHWPTFLVTVLIVGGAGAANIYRQKPVFESSAQLLIQEPVRKSEARGPNPWVVDQTQANTQQWLLRIDTALAEKVIARLRAGGMADPASLGYTPTALPPLVNIRAIAGTHLIRLSLTGSDGPSLPLVVNAYAEEYRLQEEARRSRSFNQQRDLRKDAVDDALKALEDEERVLSEYESANSDLDFTTGANPPADAARELQTRLPKLEQSQVAETLELQAIEDALEPLGIVAVEQDGRHTLTLRGDPDRSLPELLAGDSVIASLDAVRTHSEVSELRSIERAARSRDRKLETEGRKTTDQRRIDAITEAGDAHRQRGRVLVRVIESTLDRLLANATYLGEQRSQLEEFEAAAGEITARLTEHQRLEREVEARRRVKDEARAELDAFDAQYLADSTSDDATDETPMLKITVRVPAKGAVQIAPKYPAQITLTVLAALGVGIALVLLLDFIDDTIKTKEDVDRFLRVPFLGIVPRMKSSDAPDPDTAVLDAPPGSPVAEKFRALRTSIHFSRSDADEPIRTMLITSAGPGEGKTTVVANLGITLAMQSKNVLLIDADLRKPRLSSALGVGRSEVGLTSVLVGDSTLDEAVRPALAERLEGGRSAGRLCVLPSGPIPPNPAELLHLDSMKALLEACRGRFDRIIIDSPPLLAVTDARLIAPHVDGLYVVVLAEKTSRRLLRTALDSLEQIGLSAKGAILNERHRATRGKGYGYGYYYAENRES